MATFAWTGIGGPGDVRWAKATREATAVLVGTDGRHLHLRRRVGAAWRWEHVGVPPGSDEVRHATLLPTDASGTLALAAVAADAQAWLYRADGAATWRDLGGPPPDEKIPDVAGGRIVAGASPGGPTVIATAASGRPWIRQGLDADGTWSPITSEVFVIEIVSALASVADGAQPQPHLFASLADSSGFFAGLAIGVREEAVWTWVDPGGPPQIPDSRRLAATSVRDAGGRLLACFVFARGGADPRIVMHLGAGREWQSADLGKPPVEQRIVAAVVADAGEDPRAGAEPLVLVRAGAAIWTRTPSSEWRELGTPPAAAAAVSPTAAFAGGAARQPRLWAAGASSAGELWTFEADDAGVRWEEHGSPAPLNAVVGAYTDGLVDDGADGPVVVAAVDERGDLWGGHVWGSTSSGFAEETWWTYHGRPRDTVAIAKTAGVAMAPFGELERAWGFVIGSDQRLWARTQVVGGWAWVDHGAPPGTSVDSAESPIALDLASAPIVPALADDGRLWMRQRSGSEWRWNDRGAPPGQLIFSLVGACALAGGGAAVVVVTGDGHLWVSVPDGRGSLWTDLGAPGPAEGITTGIGVQGAGGAVVEVAAVGSPSGQVWTLRWMLGGAPQWTPRGRPAGRPLRAAVGTLPDLTHGAGCLVAVVGGDEQLWVAATGGPDQAWARWDPPSPATAVLGGEVALLLSFLPCAVVLDARGGAQIVTPETFM